MDIFEEYLTNKKDTDCRALTCSSYKKVYQNEHPHCRLKDDETNTELATYGDAVLKLALCELLLDTGKQLSEDKKKYETDKFLIEKVASHYDLLKYIRFDKEDKEIRQEYKYFKTKKGNKTKYIATTVEAILGDIYRENKDMNSICGLIENWIKLSDEKTT